MCDNNGRNGDENERTRRRWARCKHAQDSECYGHRSPREINAVRIIHSYTVPMQVPLTLGTSHGPSNFDADFSGESEHILMIKE